MNCHIQFYTSLLFPPSSLPFFLPPLFLFLNVLSSPSLSSSLSLPSLPSLSFSIVEQSRTKKCRIKSNRIEWSVVIGVRTRKVYTWTASKKKCCRLNLYHEQCCHCNWNNSTLLWFRISAIICAPRTSRYLCLIPSKAGWWNKNK